MNVERPIRIAQIMLAKAFGGAERSFVDLCAALARRGHEVVAIGERRGVALDKLDEHAGIFSAAITVRGTWDPVALWRMKRLLGTLRPDVVQTHLARAAAIGGRAAHTLGLPTVAKTHNYIDLKYYQEIDCLVPTTADQQEFLRRSGIPSDKVKRIANFSALPAVTTPRTVSNEPPVVLTLGRFVRKKGFDILLRAFARLAKSGVDARLVIAGSGVEDTSLRALAAQLDVDNAVEFPGWVDDVEEKLKAADVFVLPSRDEPFGIVVLEAMAAGVPIVSTRTKGPLEILDESAAWLVAMDDDMALAEAIQEALLDRPSALKRAGRALDYFKDRYSEAVVVAEYEALYWTLLRRP